MISPFCLALAWACSICCWRLPFGKRAGRFILQNPFHCHKGNPVCFLLCGVKQRSPGPGGHGSPPCPPFQPRDSSSKSRPSPRDIRNAQCPKLVPDHSSRTRKQQRPASDSAQPLPDILVTAPWQERSHGCVRALSLSDHLQDPQLLLLPKCELHRSLLLDTGWH